MQQSQICVSTSPMGSIQPVRASLQAAAHLERLYLLHRRYARLTRSGHASAF